MDSTQSTPDDAASEQYASDRRKSTASTRYTIHETTGNTYTTTEPELAETWSRAGLKVTAVTEGQR